MSPRALTLARVCGHLRAPAAEFGGSPAMMLIRPGFRFMMPNSLKRNVTYVQGQYPYPNKKIREYFYYVDHQGMLFLDDSKMKNFTSCFKEKKFLQFFFKQLKINDTDRYTEDFPYLSPCGVERNYVRCDDVPIVFTNIIEKAGQPDLLSYGHAGELLTMKFEPENIYMLPETGRVYHPAMEKVGGVGLIKSSLAIELSKCFVFEQKAPTHIVWKDKQHKLTNKLAHLLKVLKQRNMVKM